MKILIFLSLLSVFLPADYLKTLNVNRCVYDLRPKQDDSGLCWTRSDDGTNHCNSSAVIDDFIDGYEYNSTSDNCRLKNDLKISGLSQNQWDYMLAVLAHVLGFTMVFLISFLSVLVARR